MRGKRWIVTVAAVVALAIGVGGGAVMAQDAGTDGDSPVRGILSRVAEILGLDEQDVQDAFDQAAREMQDEVLQDRLAGMVESGKITQEQADEYAEWYQSRPESLGPRFGRHGFGGFGGFGRGHGRGWGGHRSHQGFQAPSGDPVPEGTSL